MGSVSKKLLIFDLDNVLHLAKVSVNQRKAYEARLLPWLQELKERGILLAVASTNGQADETLKAMKIRHFFDHVEADASTYDKTQMLKTILEKYPHVLISEITFFDDDYDNILVAQKLGIQAICIAPRTGLPVPL